MIGTVIRGTNRPEDLIPAFIGALRDRIGAVQRDPLCCADLRDCLEPTLNWLSLLEERLGSSGFSDSEECHGWLEWLRDALNVYAPEGTYFGAHPYDGSDFGFWPGARVTSHTRLLNGV